jgi:hypothetical protein
MSNPNYPLKWTGSYKVVQSRPRWPLDTPRGSSLDMRHRLPGLSAGLAALLRSMPTAL